MSAFEMLGTWEYFLLCIITGAALFYGVLFGVWTIAALEAMHRAYKVRCEIFAAEQEAEKEAAKRRYWGVDRRV